ncbi:MAG TPA: ABC transporter ATP-binding protein [Candidatus Dormibacteraeota bacterium]|nr:ABC transporter ATP-binding protein [Candidatus Dormibacteraeota bacterium]
MSALAEAAERSTAVALKPAAISARGVVRRYRTGRGVGPVDIDVNAGETVALMGRNGCGKTTLLRVLATVSRAQQGRVRWFGGGAATARHHLGLSLDTALEDGGLSGRQATHFWCAQWVADDDEVRVRTEAALTGLGLAAAADDAVASYSFGMRRRLALAAALVHGPALVLLDEPTAGLDPDGCAQLAGLIAERSQRGQSTLVASNDPGFVESVADRVAFLDEGQLVRCAPPRQLLAALPAGRLAEMVIDGGVDRRALADVHGVMAVTLLDDATVTVRFESDAAIASLVAAADAPGGRLRELHLRRPDLGDCFAELTGHPLRDLV